VRLDPGRLASGKFSNPLVGRAKGDAGSLHGVSPVVVFVGRVSDYGGKSLSGGDGIDVNPDKTVKPLPP
jgi:hypothetical protein